MKHFWVLFFAWLRISSIFLVYAFTQHTEIFLEAEKATHTPDAKLLQLVGQLMFEWQYGWP